MASGKARLDNMTIPEMTRMMEALGVSGVGLFTVDDMKSRLITALNQAEKTPSWSAGQAFSILSEAKEEDERKREVLLKFYTDADGFLDKLDEKMLSLLQKHSGNVKEDMIQHMRQLSQKEYYLLVAGETSSGKSSLVNLILGEEILPSSHLSTTSTICEVKFGEERRLVVHFKDKDPETGLLTKTILLKQSTGSCEQSYLEQISPFVHLKTDREKGSNIKKIELFWPHSLLQKGIVIVDSPGIGESDEMDEMVIQYLPEAFAFIYVINSGNAGGVQKDRLEKLLEKTKEVSLGIQKEQKEGNQMPSALLERLLSNCALFVCNKWDQVPEKDIQNVKNDVTKKLQRIWPGFDSESQITYMSTTRANVAQHYGLITEDFSSLMNAMRFMVLKSIDARLELQWGWLDNILLRIIFQAKAFVRNASRDRDTVNQKMTLILHRLGLIEKDKDKVIARLYTYLEKQVDDAVQQLSEYLSSEQVIARFTSWTLDEVPEENMICTMIKELIERVLSTRFGEVIARWEEENKVIANASVFLMQKFQKYYGDVEGQLRNLQTASTEDPCEKSTFGTTFVIAFRNVMRGFLFVLTKVVAWPIFIGEEKIMWKCTIYRNNKCTFMANASRSYLAAVANARSLKQVVQDLLKDSKLLLEQIEARLPELIQADKLLYKQLKADKRSQKEVEKLYKPIWEEGSQHRGQLAVFGITEVCPDEISLKEIDWKEDVSSRLGVGSFGAVYQGKIRRHGEVQIVALKVCQEELDVKNASEMMDEVKLLRALDHPHIVQFYGISLLKGMETVRPILVMEKCEGNLKNRIFKDPESVPGRSEDPDVVRKVCRWAREIFDGLAYIHERGVVHRDLKLENILLSQENSVRIADVGQAKPEVRITGTVAGTYVYMAPEVFNSLRYGSKADMYSMGIVLWEMWYGQHAFADDFLETPQDVFKLVDQGNRPIPRKGYKMPPFRWEQLMKQCWDGNPENRPTASECKQEMTMLQIELDGDVCAIKISREELE